MDNWFPYNFYCCRSIHNFSVFFRIIGFLIISTVVDATTVLPLSAIIGFLIISTVVDQGDVTLLKSIIGFLIISTVVDVSLFTKPGLIIGFLIISTVVDLVKQIPTLNDNWFPYNFYCCRFTPVFVLTGDNWFPYNFYCCRYRIKVKTILR